MRELSFKRIFAPFVVLVWLVFGNVAYAASGSVLLSGVPASVAPGAVVQLTIKVNTTGISGVELKPTFDPKYIQYQSYSADGTAFPNNWSTTPYADHITIARSAHNNVLVTGTQYVVTLKFKALANVNNTTITTTARADAGGNIFNLSPAPVKLAITTPTPTKPPPSGGTTNPSGSTGTSGSSPGTTADGSSSSAGSGAKDGSTDGTDSTVATDGGEAGGVLGTIGSIPGLSSLEKHNKPAFLLIIVAVLTLLAGGTWFLLRRRKQKRLQEAIPFSSQQDSDLTASQPDAEQTVAQPKVKPAETSLGSTNTSNTGSDWQASLSTLQSSTSQTPNPAVQESQLSTSASFKPQVIQPSALNPTPILNPASSQSDSGPITVQSPLPPQPNVKP